MESLNKTSSSIAVRESEINYYFENVYTKENSEKKQTKLSTVKGAKIAYIKEESFSVHYKFLYQELFLEIGSKLYKANFKSNMDRCYDNRGKKPNFKQIELVALN